MDGILPLWKNNGMTSHDCVFHLRKILHTKKIGHGGTLDPDVDGVLPICIGKGTKVIEYMANAGKIYEGEITLGVSTTTEDESGECVEKKRLTNPLPTVMIDQAMQSLEGEITQVPPMFSAVKVNGKRLYEYARNHEQVERPVRKTTIISFRRISQPIFNEKNGTMTWQFRVVCGKGTYVRTLAVDTGLKLGFPAHMSALTRLASGGLFADQCITLEQVAQVAEKGQTEELLLPLSVAVKDFPKIQLSDELAQLVKNGVCLRKEQLGLTEMPRELLALFHKNTLVSLYMAHPTKENYLKPSKVI